MTHKVLDTEAEWRHLHQQRRVFADMLGTFTSDQWAHDTVCEGWTVKDVAAHVASAPQLRLRDMPAMAWRGRFNLDRMGLEDGRRRARKSTAEILQQFRDHADSRHRMPGTLPLVDALVHTQDVFRPLGLSHEMPVDAAAHAADQTRRVAGMLGARRIVSSVRMQATDVDWVRGEGPTLRGPIQELLMVCAGRARVATDLEGDGRELLMPQA